VICAVVSTLTEVAVAVKAAVDEPAGMTTEAGTVTGPVRESETDRDELIGFDSVTVHWLA
jgi:hypothetical protein